MTLTDPSGMCCSTAWWKPDKSALECICCARGVSAEATRVNDLLYRKIGPLRGTRSDFTNDHMNAIRHCYWSCLLVQECGCGCAREHGSLKELGDILRESAKRKPWVGDVSADTWNNCEGQRLGDDPSVNCLSGCLRAFRSGRLRGSGPGGRYVTPAPPEAVQMPGELRPIYV